MLPLTLFILSVLCSSLSQYWQKKTAMKFTAETELTLMGKLTSIPLILSVLFLGLSAVTWLGVLSFWDVSMAYPLLSINFVVMLLLSHFAFKEPISPRQWVGVGIIVLGVAILGGGLTWIG